LVKDNDVKIVAQMYDVAEGKDKLEGGWDNIPK
jgi:hypothetical protein